MPLAYRLALDLGSTSLGWALIRLSTGIDPKPCAVIKAGVRIFSDGRDTKGNSLAVGRREARALRRRRDRLLKRKKRVFKALEQLGFFPQDPAKQKLLEKLDPYELRAKGLDHPLAPEEFARAIFHLNQRRGFKSNRKADKPDNDSGALKTAIAQARLAIDPLGTNGNARTVGEWLHRRRLAGQTVRARYRQLRSINAEGKAKVDKSYDLYFDRGLMQAEFESLWQKQATFNPNLFNECAKAQLSEYLWHQRRLRPVVPGRCTLISTEPRAPLALPSTQRFRILQEVNNLRILRPGLPAQELSLIQRDKVVAALETSTRRSFSQLRTLLDLEGEAEFNLEDHKREELKGNTTNVELAKSKHFGAAWFELPLARRDAIVTELLTQESEAALADWLSEHTGLSSQAAETVTKASLAEGYGSLSAVALEKIIPFLEAGPVTYARAAEQAGFHHSDLGDHRYREGRSVEKPHERISTATGEIKQLYALRELPYYGEFLQRHVGFADPKATSSSPPEKRFGRIANPTVHIGLNQVRIVVNELLKQYGHPSEVIVELARDLKQSKKQRDEEARNQALDQRRNERLRKEAAEILGIAPERVTRKDLDKLILWEELNPKDAADRKCPYSGRQIGRAIVLTSNVEIEHILPFSQTLDDSLNNKTVAMREANRIKGNRTPWMAREDFAARGWTYEDILLRAKAMNRHKRSKFNEDGLQQWLRGESGFLARALNDTRYMCRVAREYLSLICPQDTRVIPGQLTAMLRGKLGLHTILGADGVKNRNDHRHHAVDACVIGITDQGMLQRFAQANADSRAGGAERLVANMPEPWHGYSAAVARAVHNIWVSHKPDHSHEGAMHLETSYGIRGNGEVVSHKEADGKRTLTRQQLKVIGITEPNQASRHGLEPDGSPKAYKGYDGNSNYCIEIFHTPKGKWGFEVISTFQAYQAMRGRNANEAPRVLRNPKTTLAGLPLAMRLIINDAIRLTLDGELRTMIVKGIRSSGELTLCDLHEANADARNRDKQDPFKTTSKSPGALQKAEARKISISPIGSLKDPRFERPPISAKSPTSATTHVD